MNSYLADLEIDHIFQIVESEEEARKIASLTGLNVFPKTDHVGQGTSGIFLIFEECYFEFIWLRDLKEAENNFLRFDKKLEAVRKGGSPFGVAMRANLTDKNYEKIRVEDYVRYQPSYGGYTILMLKESLLNPVLPVFFFMSHPGKPENSDWYPVKSDGITNPLCNFNHQIKKFNSVQLYGNNTINCKFPGIELVPSLCSKMVINSGTAFKFSELVELVCH